MLESRKRFVPRGVNIAQLHDRKRQIAASVVISVTPELQGMARIAKCL